MTEIDKQLIDFDLGKDINEIFNNNERFKIEPTALDYMLGNPDEKEELSSVRLNYIKNIENQEEQIKEMTEYLKDTIIKQNFPDELYTWIARACLGLKYKKYEIEEMKRKYKINKKRELKEKKEEDKKKKQIEKQKKKCLVYQKKDTILKF